MRAKTILTFALFLAVRAASQDGQQTPKQAECRFADGSTITVKYSSERRNYLFATDGSIVTIGGVSVPAGDYTVSPARDSHGNWIFTMKKAIKNDGYRVLPPFPMSVTTSAKTIEDFPVSFDRAGGSCMMHWSQKDSDALLSLEFTQKNTDLPVLQ